MTNKIWRPMVRAAVLAAGLCAGTTTHAAVFYQSNFDPLDFSVKVIYEVGESCLTVDGYVPANRNAPTCTVSLYSAVATLLDRDAYDNILDKTIIKFVAPGDVLSPNPVRGIYVDDGDLVDGGDLAGIDWAFSFIPQWFPWPLIGSQDVDSADTVNDTGTLNGTYWLRFKNDGAQGDSIALLYREECVTVTSDRHRRELCAPILVPEDGGIAPLLFDNGAVKTGFKYVSDTPPYIDDDGDGFVRSAVPEPGSLALLVGALGAGWLSRRRKVVA